MGNVLFVPDLRGSALKTEFGAFAGGNEVQAMNAAKGNGWAFKTLHYQSSKNLNPLFSAMELSVLHQLENILAKTKPSQPTLLVGDGFGCGILAGALWRLGGFTSPTALLGIKPVLDPLQTVEMLFNNPQMVESLKMGDFREASLHLQNAQSIQDVFMISSKHLDDTLATRILTDKTHAERLARSSFILRSANLIYTSNDPLVPSSHIEQFAKTVAGGRTEIIALKSSDSLNFSSEVHKEVSQMIARLG